MSEVVAILCVLMWLYLIVGRGAFWLCRVRDRDRPAPDPQQWPAVVAVVPARNEADHIAASVSSLLRQDYAGPFSIVLIDDDSSDGTQGGYAGSRICPRSTIDCGQQRKSSARMDWKALGRQAGHRYC